MKWIQWLVLFWCLVSAAHAQEPDLRNPIEKYRGKGIYAHLRCGITLRAALATDTSLDASVTLPGEDRLPSFVDCIKGGEVEAKSLLPTALKFAKSSKLREALKNYHVVYMSTMNGLMPKSAESTEAYTSRQALAETRLNEAWTRVLLEQ